MSGRNVDMLTVFDKPRVHLSTPASDMGFLRRPGENFNPGSKMFAFFPPWEQTELIWQICL